VVPCALRVPSTRGWPEERLSEGEKLAFRPGEGAGGLRTPGFGSSLHLGAERGERLILDQAAIAGLLVRSLLSVLTRQMILEEIALVSDALGIE
jgi:hypothetical protein